MEKAEAFSNTNNNTPEKVSGPDEDYFDSIMEDLDALEKAIEKYPTSEKIKTYIAIDKAIAEHILETLDFELPSEKAKALGHSALGATDISADKLTSKESQTGSAPATSAQHNSNTYGGVGPDGFLLRNGEKPRGINWLTNEQND